MKKVKLTVLSAAIVLSLSACSGQNKENTLSVNNETPPSTEQVMNESKKLTQLLTHYFDDGLAFNPIGGTFIGRAEYNNQFIAPLTQSNIDAQRDFYKLYQQKLSKIDKSALQGQDLLSYEILERDLALALQRAQFPMHLMPINQMGGAHNTFAGFGSGKSAQPFNTPEDYIAFIERAHAYTAWLQSVENMMRQGIKQGVVLPKPLAQKLLPQFQVHIVSKATDSLFWGPIKNLPEDFTQQQRVEISAAYNTMILQTLVPAYQQMSDFLTNEYIPNSRNSIGYADLPNGKSWYEYEIKKHTTLELKADEIHQIGLDEVSRILNEMKKVKQTVGFEGDLSAFFTHLRTSDEFYYDTPEELIAAYEAVKVKIDAQVPLLFDVAPKADYVVKAVEDFRAESAAGASYQSPAPDGSRPGIFYINTFNLKAQPKFLLETLSIHEAAPGHHFQIALQQEIEGLPLFRKFGGYTVFAEGWALYAESLGKEMGLFTDPYMWYGRLADEQLRAMRLVLDTGFHAKGWTRQQGIDYMLANSSMAKSDIVAEVERYIAWPGQALSYKLGQFKIQELRDYAKNELGNKFDIKAFHTQILIDGALPMPILEAKIKRWVSQQ
ncbi:MULTISPECIES: DUF885 domain-containing protein [unclassified Pseudoalteromonas]|uniref:DUF885 domain-containing protein n=1 Tax=unclassified Pseudoalteromonas TaxID=194690 RepID=UPI000C068D37|nr:MULTISPECIES: DUF885 domain-containing protein [unclassified Pseudoalteromonas]MDP2633241.1 DUF885 domain-containing protein [Pseudoalteromonas sp. 1_MG-2023]PHN91782.1 DUF885 domain-containing protein [Pseudoalteromonas sp. 3D05]